MAALARSLTPGSGAGCRSSFRAFAGLARWSTIIRWTSAASWPTCAGSGWPKTTPSWPACSTRPAPRRMASAPAGLGPMSPRPWRGSASSSMSLSADRPGGLPPTGPGALALAAAMATVLPAAQAAAAPVTHTGRAGLAAMASGSGPGQNVSATVSPSWQTNDIVWALASVNGAVYVGGQFTSVRPPGDPLGTGEVARTYLAELDASTGDLITSFNPTLDGKVTALAVSPDGSTLYVGGSFTHVNGVYHAYLAAFSTSTGALLSTWKPSATASVNTIAPSPDGSAIYVGGNFAKLDGQPRTRAGAVSAATGALLPWAPNLNGTVTSIAVAPDDSRVLVGGYFTSFNGVTQQAIGSTDPATGGSATWVLPKNFIPNNSSCVSDVKDIIVNGGTAYIAAEGTGGGCFDGDFAVNISDGSLVWQSDCLGATQSLVIINGWLYKGSDRKSVV